MIYGKNYFLSANSSKGFISLFDDAREKCEKAYILKGCQGNGKSELIEKTAQTFFAEGYDVERIHCSSDVSSLDGVIMPKIGAAVFDGSLPHILEARITGVNDIYINMSDYIDTVKMNKNKQRALELSENINLSFKGLYDNLAKAKTVHDDWEKVYLKHINFDVLNSLAETVSNKMIGDAYAEKTAKVYKRFFGCATPSGNVNYIKNLTSDLTKRYFIKGRPGSGKSTMMAKIANNAIQRGLDTEIYYCSFDPDSLDMVLIRELGICIFDSTAPHEMFPSRVGDEIIDVYDAAIERGTDEKFAIELSKIKSLYAAYIRSGKVNLRRVVSLTEELEALYKPCIDFGGIDALADKIIGDIRKS